MRADGLITYIVLMAWLGVGTVRHIYQQSLGAVVHWYECWKAARI